MHGRPAAVPALPAPGEHGTARRGAARHGPAGSVLLTPWAPSCRSRRAAPVARCLSAPCSAPSTTTNPSRARRPGTAGCPSTEVSTGTPRPWCSRDRGCGGCCRPHLNVPSSPSLLAPGSPQRLRPQLPGRGAQFLLHLRPGAGRHPLRPRLPGAVRRRALPGGCARGRDPRDPWDPQDPLGSPGTPGDPRSLP